MQDRLVHLLRERGVRVVSLVRAGMMGVRDVFSVTEWSYRSGDISRGLHDVVRQPVEAIDLEGPSPPPPIGGRLALQLAQAMSVYGVPRGLPRLFWWKRRWILGNGTRTVWFQNRFRILCESESYPVLMATCGFVYYRIDRLLRRLLRPGSVFLDAGANVGFVSLLACSALGPQSGVTAHGFEPDPTVFKWLEANCRLNRFPIIANARALGSLEGEAELTVSARSGWSTLATEPNGGFTFLPKAGKVRVPVTTLDAYCRELDPAPTLVKIDVEGFECQVLDGAQKTLSRVRPYLLVEINPLRLAAAGTSGKELIRRLLDLDYKLFHVDPRSADAGSRLSRPRWAGLPGIAIEDLRWGHDFDVLAIPGEQGAGSNG